MGRNIKPIPEIPDAGNWKFDTTLWEWKESAASHQKVSLNKSQKNIFICGYVRSGNNFLLGLTSLSYNLERQNCTHKVNDIISSEHIFSPYRNPLDCISSWATIINSSIKKFSRNAIFLDKEDEEDVLIRKCINHYIRFNSAILDNKNKVTLLNFNNFIKDSSYFYDKVYKKTLIKPINKISSSDVILLDKVVYSQTNSSEDFKFKKNQLKNKIINNKKFEECIRIYDFLEQEHEKQ